MQALQNHLQQLHDRQGDPADILFDIKNVCFREVPIDQLGLLCALLFRSDQGVLQYLEVSVASNDAKQYTAARYELCIFLSELIKFCQRHQHSLADYLLEIKATCCSLFRKEEGNKVREKVLTVLMDLLDVDFVVFDTDLLEVPQLADLLLTEFACGKCSTKVKANIVKLEGLLLEKFPHLAAAKASTIECLCMDLLRKNFASRKPDMPMIAAALVAVSNLLHHFQDLVVKNPKNLSDLYKFLSLGLEQPPHVVAFHIPKAALKLLSEHAEVFRQYLTEDSKKMFVRLANLCKHHNKNVTYPAYRAMDAFLGQVSHELVEQNRSSESNMDTFKFFIKKFFDMLDSQGGGSMREVSVAIRGFGSFAGPMLMYMGVDELKKVFSKLLQYSEKFFSGEFEVYEAIHHLPSFLNAFANIILQLNHVDETHLDHLEKLTSAVFVYYPQINISRGLVIEYNRALSRLLVGLYSSGAALQALLSRVVLQGLALTCSSQLAGLEGEEESVHNRQPYQIYSYLWKAILVPARLSDWELSDEKYQAMCAVVYDQFLRSILEMMKKLNLNSTAPSAENDEEEAAGSLPDYMTTSTLQPDVPKDFELFLNLVEFAKDLLTKVHTSLFLPWVYVFGREIIRLSNTYPLISGFYKLLSIAMSLCEQHSFFAAIGGGDQLAVAPSAEEVEGDGDAIMDELSETAPVVTRENKQVCFELFSKFIREVLLRTQQYKNELLAACVKLALSVPREFIDVSLLVPALQIAFKIGRSYIELAEIGMAALEHWIQVVPDAITPCLAKVLPALNSYLRIDDLNDEMVEGDDGVGPQEHYRQRAQAAGRGKVKTGTVTVVRQGKVARLQFRILRLIGRLGGKNIFLADAGDAESSEASTVVWDTVPRVQFQLPFADSKPAIFLDTFLPRIVDLAENAQDRQTKVCACELLHAIIVYMVGASANQHNQQTQFYKIYEHMFPALIRLGTDVDQVTKQLFRPLVFQLIHWFTKNAKNENAETMKLLDAIVEAAGNPDDGALRSFSSKCLAEFLDASIKHAARGKDADKSPTNVKSLFKRLYSLAHHPDVYKRLGCAMTLNQLYRIFRENETIVNHFILEILHNTIFSLRLAHNDEESMGSAEMATSAVHNLAKIVTVYAQKGRLIKAEKKRRLHENLAAFIEWLFGEVNRPEDRCRTECMSLFLTLAPLLSSQGTAKSWVQKQLQMNSVSWLLEQFETDMVIPAATVSDGLVLDNLRSFYVGLAALMDTYHWMISNDFITPDVLVDGKEKSIVFEGIRFFLDHAAAAEDEELFANLTPSEKLRFDVAKGKATFQLVRLVTLLARDHCDFSLPGSLLADRALYRLVFLSIIAPDQFGIGQNDSARQKELLDAGVAFCGVLRTLPKKTKALAEKELAELLQSPEFDVSQLSLADVNIQAGTFLLAGYRALHGCGMLAQGDDLAEQLASKVFDDGHATQYSPTQLMLSAHLLSLCFDLGLDSHRLLEFLMNEEMVDVVEDADTDEKADGAKAAVVLKKLPKGEAFYNRFSSSVLSFISQETDTFVRLLVNNLQGRPLILRVLLDLLEMYIRKREDGQKLLQTILKQSSKLERWYAPTSSGDERESLLDLLRKMIRLDSQFMASDAKGFELLHDVFVAFMGTSIPLAFKNQALDLLAALLTQPKEKLRDVVTALNNTVAYDFPVKSQDLSKGSAVYNDYLAAIDKLFGALIASGNCLVLEVVLSVLREKDHIHQEKIASYLAHFTSSATDAQAADAFELCFSVLLEQEHQYHLCHALAQQLCVPLVHRMSATKSAVVYESHINTMMTAVGEAIEGVPTVVRKSCCLKLIQAMYDTLPPKVIREAINKVYCKGKAAKGNELTTAVMKASHSAKSRSLSGSDIPLSVCHEYHCTAYNTLASVVMCTQSKERFFTVFFFKENPEKHELLWENIVDLTQSFEFEVETRFKTVRNRLDTHKAGAPASDGDVATGGPARPRYIASQYFKDSSLSQDMSYVSALYTPSAADQQQAPAQLEQFVLSGAPVEDDSEAQKSAVPQKKGLDGLELDPVNENPCMGVLLRLLDHMTGLFGDSYTDVLPDWMELMLRAFSDPSVHSNVKLFIAKVLINRPAVFERYASHWLKPLLELSNSPAVGKGLNYFLRDICITILLSWPKVTPNGRTEDHLATKLFNHLLCHAIYTNPTIVKYNLDLIKLYVERFKDHIAPSKSVILELLSAEIRRSSSKIRRQTGLQIQGVLIANGFPLYDARFDQKISEVQLIDALVGNLKHTSKGIYRAASEICGLVMLKEGMLTVLGKKVKDQLSFMLQNYNKDHNIDRVLECLSKIGLHCDQFLDTFFLHLFDLLPKLFGVYSVMGLQLVLLRAQHIDGLFKKLHPILDKLLSQRNPEAQLVSLQVFKFLMDDISDDLVLHYVDTLGGAFAEHTDAKCRDLYFDILVHLYDHAPVVRDHTKARTLLLRGLFDEEASVSEKVFRFWNSPDRLSSDVLVRLTEVFKEVYSPEIEESWLKYSTRLLLSLTANSAEYEVPLFPPLTNAQFHDYAIDCSWQNRSLPMSPLFSSQSMSMFELEDEIDYSDPSFPLDDGDVDGDVEMVSPAERSQIRFTATPATSATAATYGAGTQFPAPSQTLSASQASRYSAPASPSQFHFTSPITRPVEGGKTTLNVLRRFNKQTTSHPTAVGGGTFDRIQVLKQKRSRERKRVMAERRRNRITMLRTYRTGELPDVQLKPKELIEPLQVLIGRDSLVSRHTFAALFKALVGSLDKRSSSKLKLELKQLIEDLLEQSACTPPFISCLQWICFESDIPLEASLVTSTSLKSFNYHTGIMLLEKQLLVYTEAPSGRSKKASVHSDELQDDWMELIKLYKALGDEDVLRGIFEKQLCSSTQTKEALEAELHGDYKAAHEVYLRALESLEGEDASMEAVPSEMEVQLWESSRMECLSKLLSWKPIAELTLQEANGEAEQLWKPELREPYLNYFIQSHLYVKSLVPSLEEFVDRSSLKERQVLEEEFVAEMAMLSVYRDDLDRARYFVKRYYEQFLNRWSMLHPLATVSRRGTLKSLQRMVELDEFLFFCKYENNFKDEKRLQKLLAKWHSRIPSAEFHDINVWNDVVSTRTLLFDKLFDRFSLVWANRTPTKLPDGSDAPFVDLPQLKKQLLVERSHTYLCMATGARKRNNLPVSELYLKLSLKSSKASDDNFSFPFFRSLVKLYTRKAKITKSFDKFNMALEYVEEKKSKAVIAEDPLNSQRTLLLQADILQEMAALAKEDPSSVKPIRMVKVKKGSTAESALSNTARRCLERACQTFRASDDPAIRATKGAAKAFLALAKFCDDSLVRAEVPGEDHSSSKTHRSYAEVVMTNVLDAMALQLAGARDRFPRLLQLVASYPHLAPIFMEKVEAVPTWMFIRWISQMMGVLDRPEGPAVSGVLTRLAHEYPQALFYSFKISTENLTGSANAVVGPLRQILANPLLDDFIDALSKLTHPEHRFKDWTEALKVGVREKDSAKLVELFYEIQEDCFNPRAQGIGSYNRQFASTWAAAYTSKMGKDGSKLAKMDLRALVTVLQPMLAKMTSSIQPRGTGHMKVTDFSMWLVEFDRSNQLGDAEQIEIPGQYDGLSCPQVHTHTFISSFDSDMLVMGSLRKPKRLKIRGNDQQDHPFLVKGGEDLRLDQRVQQLFSVMNELFRTDTECTRRSLCLPTYEVVPMTGKVGLIEWIDNTKPIKALIEDELAKLSGKKDVSIQKIPAAKVHDQWLRSFGNSSKLGDLHGAMYKKASRSSCIKKVEEQNSKVPGSLLRTGVLSLSSSPEAYLSIRAHFARSLAAFSIASYIIGIGDRHLENFLLNFRDGGLVGIDFGHAFGTATQFLPVPELVPFRLTRQFTEFLQPLDSEGLLNHNMIHCLRTLQAGKEILLDTMQVFITEPLLDWEKLARRCAREQGGDEEEPGRWFRKEKIAIAEKKLLGHNPVDIMISELRTSVHGKKPYLSNLEDIVRGDRRENVRATAGQVCTSVAQQVECLVDLATDPNVLGRMYGGWAAWI